MQQTDELLAKVESGGEDDDAHRLLRAFYSGYPIENLRRVLLSSNDAAAKAGAWIASELGVRAAPVLPFMFPLLRHSSRYVRFFILDVVLTCAGRDDGALLAEAISLVRDSDNAVRWKAMQLLARATNDQLNEGQKVQVDEELQVLTNWLVHADSIADPLGVIGERLESGSSLVQMFSVVAAARIGRKGQELLHRAAALSDRQIKEFAEDQLRLLA